MSQKDPPSAVIPDIGFSGIYLGLFQMDPRGLLAEMTKPPMGQNPGGTIQKVGEQSGI